MSKNFETIHENGVYETEKEDVWVIAPKKMRGDRLNCWYRDNGYIHVGFRVSELPTESWMPFKINGSSDGEYSCVEYIGEYDWDACKIIFAEEKKMDKEKNLVSENQIGTEKVYELGIFRLKKTTYTNGNESTVEIGCKGVTQCENPLEILTFNEFKQLQELIKDISLD